MSFAVPSWILSLQDLTLGYKYTPCSSEFRTGLDHFRGWCAALSLPKIFRKYFEFEKEGTNIQVELQPPRCREACATCARCSRTRTQLQVLQIEVARLQNQLVSKSRLCALSVANISGGASSGTSPRPLSKVRTSFVTVERSGQMGIGLKRENSGTEPSMAKRRTSFSIDEQDHPKETVERKESIATEFQARKNSTAIKETIPESAVETPQSESNKRLGGGDQKKQTAKPTKVEEKTTGGPSNGHTNGSVKPAAVKSADKPTTAKTISKPAAISTAKTTTAAKVSPKKARTPVPKTPTTPVRSQVKQAPAKIPDKKPEKKPEKKSSRASLASTNTSKPASKPATSTAHGSAPKTRIQPSPPQTGFVKPRPKSPTRPIKLPASLTAHTASSGSKTAIAPPQTSSRQSLSRASGNIQPTNSLQAHHAVSRSPSRASTTGKTTLARKPSILKPGHSRPSLGPPPAALKKQSSRQSLPQQAAPADEGFLARMMRPTTSSASKTIAEKTPLTPPKRSQSVKRPETKDGPPNVVTPLASPAAKPKAAPKEVKDVASSSKATPIKKEEKPKVVEPVKAAKEEIVKAPAEAAPAEITEPAEEPKAEVEEAKLTEPDINHIDEPVAAKEELVVVEKETVLVKDEPVVAPPAAKVEALVPEVAKEEKHEVSVVEEPVAKAEPEHVDSDAIVEQKASVPASMEELEDPEDAKARQEIERLNAEVMKAQTEDVE